MRCLLLALVAGLAVFAVQIHAQEEPVVDHEEELINLSDEQMARTLADLFDDDDFAEAAEEKETKRQARARGEDPQTSVGEEKAVAVDAKDQARYNNFIDTFLRRLNSYARSQFDPLTVGLGKKSKKGKASKPKSDKKKKPKKGKKSSKKSGKGKKKGRHPKDLDLDEVEPALHESELPEELHAEEEEVAHEVSKREVQEIEVFEINEEEEEEDELDEEDDEVEEESLVRVARDAEETADDAEDVSRRGKPAKSGKKGATKKGGKKKGGKKGGAKKAGKKGKKGGKKGGKKAGKKGGKKSKRSAKGSSGPKTSRATVKGIASLQRSGDVLVVNKGGGKEMRAKFSLGPVDLSMNRKFGQGKSAIVREAKATSPELTGKLSILVAQNGKAKITNFHITRPAIVQVDGTLHKTSKGGKNDNNFMENSLSRISPLASKKLKIASRKILSAGEAKSNQEE